MEHLLLLFSVVGQFDKVSKHVGLHGYTAHNLISIQNLITGKQERYFVTFEDCLDSTGSNNITKINLCI